MIFVFKGDIWVRENILGVISILLVIEIIGKVFNYIIGKSISYKSLKFYVIYNYV